jgi:FkbM family methyltransferase
VLLTAQLLDGFLLPSMLYRVWSSPKRPQKQTVAELGLSKRSWTSRHDRTTPQPLGMRFSTLKDNVSPHLRHFIKYATSGLYRSFTTLRRVSAVGIASRSMYLEERITSPVNVCDVGAFYIKSLDPGVRRMLQLYPKVTRITLVEPQAEEADALKRTWEREFGKDRVSVLYKALGDGHEIDFWITNDTAASAGFEPNLPFHNAFPGRTPDLAVTKKTQMKTTTLDQALGGAKIDHLVMDIQGMEMAVLKASPKTLNSLCIVECESDLQEFYKGQPLFGDVFNFMRSQGFEIFTFRKLGVFLRREFRARPAYTWYPWRSNFFEPRELTFTQPVFVRTDFTKYNGSHEDVLKAAFVLEKVYFAFDRAYQLLQAGDRQFKQSTARPYYESLPNRMKRTEDAA